MFRFCFVLILLCSGFGLSAETGVKGKIAARHNIISEDVWYGFRRTTFEFEGHTAWVAEPAVEPAEGCPWTWTMQWAEAFVDRTGVLDLLAEGWHHVTIDIYDERANDEALKVAADFQKFLVEELGFAPKTRLVGMSWGGFFSVRYAALYPQNVLKIYLDAPLLMFGKEFPHDIGWWTDKEPISGGWSDDSRMPRNLASVIAAGQIPVLLLYGGQDQTVIPSFNCEPFVEALKASGGIITVNKRDGFGHHPHGLDPDKTQQITDFFKF